MSDEPKPLEDEAFEPSRTQKKRQVEALQALGERLLLLSPKELSQLPIPDILQEALDTARKTRSREAQRRERQRIGKVMRYVDPEPIQQALDALYGDSPQAVRNEKLANQWRERLLEGGDAALAEFLHEHPSADRQQLRQLMLRAQQEVQDGAPPKFRRQLFRALREMIGQH